MRLFETEAGEPLPSEDFRGNHLSSTTCLTHALFKSGE